MWRQGGASVGDLTSQNQLGATPRRPLGNLHEREHQHGLYTGDHDECSTTNLLQWAGGGGGERHLQRCELGLAVTELTRTQVGHVVNGAIRALFRLGLQDFCTIPPVGPEAADGQELL